MRLEPRNPSYPGELGLLLLSSREYGEAVDLLRRTVDSYTFSLYWRTELLQACNAYASTLLVRADTQAEGLRYASEAEGVWDDLLQLEWALGAPGREASVERGKTLVLTGRYSEAIALLSSYPDPDVDTWLEAAEALEGLGR